MSKNIVLCPKNRVHFVFIMINEKRGKHKKYLKKCWKHKQGTGSLINLIIVMNVDEVVQC